MFNAVIRFALQYRMLVVVISLGLLLYGTFLATQMPIDVFPDLDRPRVIITFGRPFRLRWPDDDEMRGGNRAHRNIMGQMTDEAMVQLAAVLPPEMRGVYSEGDPDNSRWLEFAD